MHLKAKPSDSKFIFFLEPSSLQHAFCTLLITVLSYLIFCCQASPQAPWFLLSSLLFSQVGFQAEAQWQKAWKMGYYLLFSGFVALCVFVLSLYFLGFIYKVTFILALVFISSYLGWLHRSFFFAGLTLALFSVVATYLPGDLFLARERAYLIFSGGLLVFAIRFLFFFYRRSQAFFYAKASFFQKLKQLYYLIFYAPPSSRLLFNFEWEESHFQIAWSNCLSALEFFKSKVPAAYHQGLDRIWDLTLSLGSLRYRLSDFSVLSMSEHEMQALLAVLLEIFDELRRRQSRFISEERWEALQAAIQKFEELYQAMLQTVAKEPLVLLLFIQDLYALKEELEKLSLHLYKGQNGGES